MEGRYEKDECLMLISVKNTVNFALKKEQLFVPVEGNKESFPK